MIIFGLGNPGLKYRSTRHNAGYILLDHFSKKKRRRFKISRGFQTASVVISGQNVVLVKPHCWMNQSGAAVQHFLKKNPDDYMVIIDDINLPLGRMRLRARGSDGGHLGLRSIIEAVAADDFPRLRIGIGQPQVDAAEYVLDRFNRKEKKILKQVIDEGIKGIEILLTDGMNKAQNHINGINLTDKSETNSND